MGVRAIRSALPFLVLSALLACKLELQIKQPSLAVEAGVAYSSADSITIRYMFFADEEVLRCRYRVSRGEEALVEGITGVLQQGTWYQQPLELPRPVEQGRYELRVVVQAERNGEFVDLAFLDQTRDFYIDDLAPVDPPAPGGATVFASGFMHVFLTHPELTSPQASPINIRYTLDNTLPTLSSTVYNPQTGIVRPVSDYALPLKAAAFDLAGHAGPVYEQSALYEDSQTPEKPAASLSDQLRFKTAQSVTLTHPELSEPRGSPVTLFYTLDGTDPGSSPSRVAYSGSFVLPFDRGTVPFRCVAEDAVGNKSEVLSRSYKFTAITSTRPSPLQSPPAFLPIEILGFGFVGVDADDITMRDASGKTIMLFYNTFSEGYILFGADMRTANPGTARIEVVVHDAGPVTHQLSYLVTP